MSFQHFRLQAIAPQPPQDQLALVSASAGPSSLAQALGQPQHDPIIQNVQLQSHGPNNQKKGPYGSGDADDGYTLIFESMAAFQAWRQREEEEKMVEFVKGDTHGSKAVPPRFKDHTKLVCARHSRSGRKKYVKKFPDRVRKVPSRKVRIVVLLDRGHYHLCATYTCLMGVYKVARWSGLSCVNKLQNILR